ncbi:hypothetical protein VNO77_18022 [Canavalia gladiata]|uniref:Uncharacterized protein n=1 Tax=Canavalia gladiata TaxID=3824 RepID=A0AAN9QJX1_CANGL
MLVFTSLGYVNCDMGEASRLLDQFDKREHVDNKFCCLWNFCRSRSRSRSPLPLRNRSPKRRSASRSPSRSRSRSKSLSR